MQRMKIKLQKYKKENEVLVKRLRSIKIKNLYKDKQQKKTGEKIEEKLISNKKMVFTSNTVGIRNSHPIQPSSTKNIRGVGILYQNNLKMGGYATSRKSDNIPLNDPPVSLKDRRRHIRAKSDIPILTQLMREGINKAEVNKAGEIFAKRFEKKENRDGFNVLRCSGDTPMSARTAGLIRRSIDKEFRRERFSSNLTGNLLFSNIKVLNNQSKSQNSDKSYAEKLKSEMLKTHRRKWRVKYAKLSKVEKSINSPDLTSLKKKKQLVENLVSKVSSGKTTRDDEESFRNSGLKKFTKALNFNEENKMQIKAKEEYDLDFRASSQRAPRFEYDNSMTEVMPSVKVNKKNIFFLSLFYLEKKWSKLTKS